MAKSKVVKKQKAVLYNTESNTRLVPEYDVILKELDGYKILKLKASKSGMSPWTEHLKGKDIITIEDLDTSVNIILHKRNNRPDIKMTMSYCDLCDLVTAFETLDYFHKKQYGRSGREKYKIGKIKTKNRRVKWL